MADQDAGFDPAAGWNPHTAGYAEVIITQTSASLSEIAAMQAPPWDLLARAIAPLFAEPPAIADLALALADSGEPAAAWGARLVAHVEAKEWQE